MSAGPEQIARAVRTLRAGGVVAFPTETVYGLGADALNESAVARVYALKGRPAPNPLIVHVADEEGARRVVREWTGEASRLARAFWPGPLSIVLPRAPDLPALVTGGGPTVAVRSPDHRVALALLHAFAGPVAAPSANRSGEVSPTTAAHVRASFSPSEVLVLDGGACPGGIESTVLDLASPEPRILRPGPIGPEAIARALGRSVRAHTPDDAGPAGSPGRLGRHYSPAAPVRLVDLPDVDRLARGARGPVVLLAHRSPPPTEGVRVIRMPARAAAYAAGLYAALRRADRAAPALILVERVPEVGEDEASSALWRAITDRLERAAGA